MGQVFNISASTRKSLDKLYTDKIIDSKERFIELAIAVGISTMKKQPVRNPRPFHTLSEMDKDKVFSIIAINKNLDLETQEDVTKELEMYAEAGFTTLMEKELSEKGLNYYKILKRYSDL